MKSYTLMLEYLTRLPLSMSEGQVNNHPNAWFALVSNDETVSNLFIEDGKVKYHWTHMWIRPRMHRTYITHSPAVAVVKHLDGIIIVLCADLSRYLYLDATTELLRLYDHITICQAYDDFQLNNRPPLPPYLTEDAWIAYTN